MGHDLVLHQVLDLLHGGRPVHFQAAQLYKLGDALDLHRCHAGTFLHALVGFRDGGDDLGDIEYDLGAVALDDFHALSLRIVSVRFVRTISIAVNPLYSTRYGYASGKCH